MLDMVPVEENEVQVPPGEGPLTPSSPAVSLAGVLGSWADTLLAW